jgi:hypothetical protein
VYTFLLIVILKILPTATGSYLIRHSIAEMRQLSHCFCGCEAQQRASLQHTMVPEAGNTSNWLGPENASWMRRWLR